MPTQRLRRRGWSLIDLLTAGGCAVVLLGLIVPAVQSARSSARQEQCKNNLKQIGLAMHNYHEVYNLFPPGWVAEHGSTGPAYGYGWGARILSAVGEHRELYQQIPFGRNPMPAANKLLQTSVPEYRCPEDGTPDVNPLRGNYGTSNYSGNYGTHTAGRGKGTPLAHWLSPRRANNWPGELPPPLRTDGIFYLNSSISLADVTDGTSLTFLVGERSAKSGAGVWPGVGSNAFYNDVATDCSPGNEINSGFTSFSSYHPGGAQFVFCDGRVVLVNETIDRAMFRSMATRNGGDLPPHGF